MKKKNEKLIDSPARMWFSGQYVNGGGPIANRTWEDFLALGAMGEMMREREKIRKWESWREWESQKLWGKEIGEWGFCRGEEREELWRMWRGEGDKENEGEEEKEIVGNH